MILIRLIVVFICIQVSSWAGEYDFGTSNGLKLALGMPLKTLVDGDIPIVGLLEGTPPSKKFVKKLYHKSESTLSKEVDHSDLTSLSILNMCSKAKIYYSKDVQHLLNDPKVCIFNKSYGNVHCDSGKTTEIKRKQFCAFDEVLDRPQINLSISRGPICVIKSAGNDFDKKNFSSTDWEKDIRNYIALTKSNTSPLLYIFCVALDDKWCVRPFSSRPHDDLCPYFVALPDAHVDSKGNSHKEEGTSFSASRLSGFMALLLATFHERNLSVNDFRWAILYGAKRKVFSSTNILTELPDTYGRGVPNFYNSCVFLKSLLEQRIIEPNITYCENYKACSEKMLYPWLLPVEVWNQLAKSGMSYKRHYHCTRIILQTLNQDDRDKIIAKICESSYSKIKLISKITAKYNEKKWNTNVSQIKTRALLRLWSMEPWELRHFLKTKF